MSYYWLFFPALIIFFPIFMLLWTDTRFRYWRVWTPIRRISDFFWNLQNSKGNYGHWIHSNRFGGQCIRCGVQSIGGRHLAVFGPHGMVTCDDLVNQKIVEEVMEG